MVVVAGSAVVVVVPGAATVVGGGGEVAVDALGAAAALTTGATVDDPVVSDGAGCPLQATSATVQPMSQVRIPRGYRDVAGAHGS